MLGHGVRRMGRHAHHGDACFAAGGAIDVVVAGAAQGHELDAEAGQDVHADAVGLVTHHRVATGGRRRGGGAEPELVEMPADTVGARRPRKIVAVVGLGVVNRRFDHRRIPFRRERAAVRGKCRTVHRNPLLETTQCR